MPSIGIDLGTTNTVAAYCTDDGEVKILTTETGERFIPSVVGYHEGALLVGRPAVLKADGAPQDTIFSVKRLMGRSFNDHRIPQVREHYSYAVSSADETDDHGVRVMINNVKYTPESISARILGQIKKRAKEVLGEEVAHAVITVPAYYNERQRGATRDAALQAGLVVKKIVDEPTAAAVAYGFERPEEAEQLLVFDMGGGTLDISILFVADREFCGDWIAGDRWLGGDDFDHVLVDMICQWVQKTYDVSVKEDGRFKLLASQQAEKAKRQLSEDESVDIVMQNSVRVRGGAMRTVRLTITRAEFEDRIRPLVDKSIKLVKEALDSKGWEPGDMARVLLVGGATYTPLVRRALAEMFGEDKVPQKVDPMEAVAHGAAILAEKLHGVECPNHECKKDNPFEADHCSYCGKPLATGRHTGQVGLHEKTERDFGICVVDDQGDMDHFSVVIERGTHYPLEKPRSRRFHTTSRMIQIPVYAGDRPKASQNEYLGLVEHSLPSDAPAQTPLTVTFNYDQDRILTVKVEVENRPELTREGTPERKALKQTDKATTGKWRELAEQAIHYSTALTERYGEFIEKEDREALEAALTQVKATYSTNDNKNGPTAVNHLWEVQEKPRVAQRLYFSDQVMDQVSSDTAEILAGQAKSLRDAYRAEDDGGVTRIMSIMDALFGKILEALPGGRGFTGYHGLLRVLDKRKEGTGEPSS